MNLCLSIRVKFEMRVSFGEIFSVSSGVFWVNFGMIVRAGFGSVLDTPKPSLKFHTLRTESLMGSFHLNYNQ